MRIAICDDEINMLNRLAHKIKKCFLKCLPNVHIISYNNGERLIYDCQNIGYNIVFLDIDMPDISGIDMASTIREMNNKTIIVFISNRDDLVFNSIKCCPFRFIRKSCIEEELNEAVLAIIKKLSTDDCTLEVTLRGVKLFFKVKDILCFTSVKHTLYAITKGETYTIPISMKKAQDRYEKFGFVRTHNSYLVNYRYIFSVDKETVCLDNGESLPLSRHRIQEVKEKLHYYNRRW